MQINTTPKSTSKRKRINGLLVLAILALVLLLVLVLKKESTPENEYFCDMETVNEEGNRFKAGIVEFTNAQTQNKTKAFSGQFSARCDSESIYGPGIDIDQVNSGDIIEASVWQQSDEGYGALIFQGLWGTYFQASSKAHQVQNGWELLRFRDTIPLGVSNGVLRIFPSISAKSGIAYYDDLKIKHIKGKGEKTWEDENYVAEWQLQVEEKEVRQLKIKRSEAFARGNLITGKKDLVPAKLKDQEKEVDVSVRLKGDLLDHLQGQQWSFRIVPKKGQAWNGMKEFSVHNSKSRSHLQEWIFHKMLEQENILTTAYDFVQFSLNEEVLGIYAFEEHFAYPLLYRQNRERGPILRISEDGLWEYAAKGLAETVPWYESAQIETFEESEILKDEALKQQFLLGQNLLYDFIQGNKSPAELFDIDLYAKYTALLDICMAWHAFGSANQRFYYNAVLGKLEPLGYDGYGSDGTQWYKTPRISGAHVNSRVPRQFYFRGVIQHFHYFLFNDYDFVEKYVFYLDQFSSEAYLQQFLNNHLSEIKSREQFIKREYSDYKFNEKEVFKNAISLREILYPSEEVSIKAYQNSQDQAVLENYHSLPIEIIGFGNKEITQRPTERLILEAYHKEFSVRRYSIPMNGKAKFVFCKTLGTAAVKKIALFNWPIPESSIPKRNANLESLKNNPAISISPDSTIYIKSGLQVLQKDLIIPGSHRLRISAGTELRLQEGVSIVSYGPVFFEGSEAQPILIKAQQGGQGLLVIDAPEQSQIQHTYFIGLSARNKAGQIAKGGVTFYKSDLACRHCHFQDSRAKDALHIFQSTYALEDSRFENSSGDALAVQLSSGSMNNMNFKKTGKDAIEIIGGFARIKKISVARAFGAALHATRNAQVEIPGEGNHIANSRQGIIASDRSEITIDNLNLDKVEQGFVVFKKLPEYGSAIMKVDRFEEKEVKQLYVLDQEAEVYLRGKRVVGK